MLLNAVLITMKFIGTRLSSAEVATIAPSLVALTDGGRMSVCQCGHLTGIAFGAASDAPMDDVSQATTDESMEDLQSSLSAENKRLGDRLMNFYWSSGSGRND